MVTEIYETIPNYNFFSEFLDGFRSKKSSEFVWTIFFLHHTKFDDFFRPVNFGKKSAEIQKFGQGIYDILEKLVIKHPSLYVSMQKKETILTHNFYCQRNVVGLDISTVVGGIIFNFF